MFFISNPDSMLNFLRCHNNKFAIFIMTLYNCLIS